MIRYLVHHYFNSGISQESVDLTQKWLKTLALQIKNVAESKRCLQGLYDP